MITQQNYFEKSPAIFKAIKPDSAILKGHDFFVKASVSGTDWSLIEKNKTIAKTVSDYLKTFNVWVEREHSNLKEKTAFEYNKPISLTDMIDTQKLDKALADEKLKKAPEPKKEKWVIDNHQPINLKTTNAKTKAPVKKPTPKVTKKTPPKPVQKSAKKPAPKAEQKPKVKATSKPVEIKEIVAKPVNILSPEIVLFHRIVDIEDKRVRKSKIQSLLDDMQTAILDKRITKKSAFAKEVIESQKFLIQLLHSCKSLHARAYLKKHVQIPNNLFMDLLDATAKEVEFPSVQLLRAYTKLHNREIEKQEAHDLAETMQQFVKEKIIPAKDPYRKNILTAHANLKTFVEKGVEGKSVVPIMESELNGLMGIVQPSLSGLPVSSSSRIATGKQIANMHFEKLGFTGKWLELIGDPSPGFRMMVSAPPKFGKSFMSLELAAYLVEHFGNVLYVASEEKIDATLQQKILSIPALHSDDFVVTEYLPNDLSKFDFVFIDSVNDLQLKPEELQNLKVRFPNTSWVYVFQYTKGNRFKGSLAFEHNMDIVVEFPERGLAQQKGRYKAFGELRTFVAEQ